MTSYLAHHGVLGQKWGVRNGPPYPIEHPVMKKGTKLSTVVGSKTLDEYYTDIHKSHKNKAVYTFNPDDEWDSAIYKGPFSWYLAKYRCDKYIAEHRLETIRDLKMPNKKQRIDEFKKLYNDPRYKKKIIKEVGATQQRLKTYNIGSTESQNVDLKNLKTDDDFKAAYEVFNHTMEAAHRYKSTSEYMKRMSKKYDAMVDDNNQSVYNDAHDPVIIFKVNDLIYSSRDLPIRNVKNDDIIKNYNRIEEEMTKRGETVKL